MRILASVGVAVLFAANLAAQGMPLTDDQFEAVKRAHAKLSDLARNGAPQGTNPWKDTDPRWTQLFKLCMLIENEEAFRDGDDDTVPVGPARFESGDTDGSGAVTLPMNEEFSGETLNTVRLNDMSWTGPDRANFGFDIEEASCVHLAALLLHEASHNCDNYAWPDARPPNPPDDPGHEGGPELDEDKRAHACGEFRAHRIQTRTITEVKATIPNTDAGDVALVYICRRAVPFLQRAELEWEQLKG